MDATASSFRNLRNRHSEISQCHAGSLALILHAHLPFVRHPEHEDFLEEDWLFEAITETYIPLLGMMQRLVRDGVPFKLTMSLTPTLCAMLQDQLLRERYLRYLDRAIDLAAARDRAQSRRRAAARARGILSRNVSLNAGTVSSKSGSAICSAPFAKLREDGCARDHRLGRDARISAAAAAIARSRRARRS